MRGRRVGSPREIPFRLGTASTRSERRCRSCRCRWRASAGCACRPSATRSSVVVDGVGLVIADGQSPPLSSNGTAAKRSRQAFSLAKASAQRSCGRGLCGNVMLRAGLHVDLVDAGAIGRIGEAGLQLARRISWPGRRLRCRAGPAAWPRSRRACGCGRSAHNRRCPAWRAGPPLAAGRG